MNKQQSITIRMAMPGDASAIERLAQLEGARTPRGELLVAEVDGELWAAIELECGELVADPFRPSGDLAEFLRRRVERLNGREPRRGIRRARPHRLLGPLAGARGRISAMGQTESPAPSGRCSAARS